MYLVFLIFCIKKKKSGNSIPLTQKERCPKRYPNLFFEGHFFQGLSQWQLCWGCRGLSFVLDLSDQICTFVLHDLAWYSCLFVYLCLMGCCMIFWWMVFSCLYCLLKAFLNYHSVCHSNNNVCTTFQQLVVVVTMDHRSSLDSSTPWRTHKLIA